MARKNKRKSFLPALVIQAGLQTRWRRGELAVVEMKDEDAPQKKVTRLKRQSSIDQMVHRGVISSVQHDYAERYAILCEKACGRTQDRYATMQWIRSAHPQWEPSPVQQEAYKKLFLIWSAIGNYHCRFLDLIVLENYSSKQIAEKFHLNYQCVIGQVLSTFILLQQVFERYFDCRSHNRLQS
ncbi:hypothetical protein COMNV_01337 [Commensalibacter sp. Nvir]|uniref:hypothetical protein n=1 Tax=Commensalibacter sp. Nvir TaxID=3069817 RepID=UPI002D2F9D20|nr:hypothetical protein COMNV_01337 [Commensalibacter sp. Nvir]